MTIERRYTPPFLIKQGECWEDWVDVCVRECGYTEDDFQSPVLEIDGIKSHYEQWLTDTWRQLASGCACVEGVLPRIEAMQLTEQKTLKIFWKDNPAFLVLTLNDMLRSRGAIVRDTGKLQKEYELQHGTF